MKNRKIRSTILIICLVLFIVALSFTFTLGRKNAGTITVGFIMTGSVNEEGWNGMHYQGIKSSCDELGVKLIVKENILENTGDCKKAVEELIKNHASLIFLSSYNYSAEVKELISKYDDVVFYCSSLDIDSGNSYYYFVRYYQARYLSGIIAGMQTQTNQIGYVAAFENTEVIRGIDAFTLGVKRVNPDATVYVAWSNTWNNEEIEENVTCELIDNTNIDVITYHQNQPHVAMVAEKRGIYSIGYHQPLENASDKFLTAVVCEWENSYEELIRIFMKGTSVDNNILWLGIESDTVKLSELSPLVSSNTLDEIDKATNEILNGKDVFSGIIYDNQGNIRCTEGENIRDEILLHNLDWFVDGVEIYSN